QSSNIPEALSKKDLEALPDDLLDVHIEDLHDTIQDLTKSKADKKFIAEALEQLSAANEEQVHRYGPLEARRKQRIAILKRASVEELERVRDVTLEHLEKTRQEGDPRQIAVAEDDLRTVHDELASRGLS